MKLLQASVFGEDAVMSFLNLFFLSSCLTLNVLPSESGVAKFSLNPTSCRTYDEYGFLSYGNERARLDEYAKQLKEESEAVGIIMIFPGGKQSFKKAQSRASRVMDHLVNKRGVNPDHVGAITLKEARQKFETQLMICPFFPPGDLRRMYDGKVIVGTELKKSAP